MRSPIASFLAGRAKARQRSARFALVQHDLDAGGRLLAHAQAVEPGRNDLGVVEDQHVARPQEIRQVADAQILESGLRPDHEHARGIARLRRTERDAALGQIEIEEVDAHECFGFHARLRAHGRVPFKDPE